MEARLEVVFSLTELIFIDFQLRESFMFNLKLRTFGFLLVVFSAILCNLLACDRVQKQTDHTVSPEVTLNQAVAVIHEINGSGLIGTATFTQMKGMVHVIIEIKSASEGLHASHLHDGDCAEIGPHWHPMSIPSGYSGVPVAEATLEVPPVGIGEIGNIPVDETGTGTLEFTTPFWTIGTGETNDILGKLIVIHEAGDSFLENLTHQQHGIMPMEHAEMEMETDPMESHAIVMTPGAKIGCGVVK